MKKIKKINIKYFQTHEDTSLDFSDGITVLVGKTDSGKTAIIRALKLLIKNKPRGNGFISVFAPSDKKNKATTRVSMTLEDDTEIIRTKSENKNEYIVKKENTENSYNNFGINIPPEIDEEIGSYSVKIDKDTYLDVNFAEQLSQPFLLFESPAIKTKLIDKIARIDVLNKAIKNTKIKTQEIKNSQKKVEDKISSCKEELKNFESLEEEKIKLALLKQKYKEYIDKKEQLEKLISLKENLEQIESKLNQGKSIKEQLSDFIDFANLKIKSLKEKYKNYCDILDKYNNLNYLQKEIITTKNIIQQKNLIDKFTQVIVNIKNNFKHYVTLKDLYLKWSSCSQNWHLEQDKVKRYKNILLTEESLLKTKNKFNEMVLLKDLLLKITQLNESIAIANKYIPEQKMKLKLAIDEKNNLYKDLKICPICKKPFDNCNDVKYI